MGSWLLINNDLPPGRSTSFGFEGGVWAWVCGGVWRVINCVPWACSGHALGVLSQFAFSTN